MISAMKNHSITVYGIPNCDTVKKARAWLDAQNIDYTFHDFKKLGAPPALVDGWIATIGWEPLLNRKGTTWRKLDPATQGTVTDPASASALMQVNTSVIKRPVVDWGTSGKDALTVGFDPEAWAARI
jgi:Spx/MgsR family transcriptional regulator